MKRKNNWYFMVLTIFLAAFELYGQEKISQKTPNRPGISNLEKLNFSMGQAFFANGDYFRAESEFLRLINLNSENIRSFYGWQAKLYLNRIHLLQGRDNEALVSLSVALPLLNLLLEKNSISENFFSDWKKDLAFAHFQIGMYRKSGQLLTSVKMARLKYPGPASQVEADRLEAMIHSTDALDKFFSDKDNGFTALKRRPWLAGLMSFFIPGLGQAYNGEYSLGLLSFSAVGSLGAISYFSFSKRNYVGAYLSLYLALVFHGHNINRAMESSWHFNETLAEREIRYYEAKFTRFLEWWPEKIKMKTDGAGKYARR